MRFAVLAILAACGSSSAHTPEQPAPMVRVRTTEAALVARGERLTDPVSSAIEDAIDADVGYPVRVVARIDLGDRMLVLYAMNGLTHWLARRPDRAELTAAVEACRAEGESDRERNCIDTALRDAREPELIASHLAWCVPANDNVENPEEACIESFHGSFVFDVEAYCDRGFWSLAREEHGRWIVNDAGPLERLCLAEPIDARVTERDGAPLVLLDAVYKNLDAMRLVNEHDVRTLSAWRLAGDAMEHTFATEMGTYAVDLGPMAELRCRYEIERGTESLQLECCREPLPEDDEEEAPRAGPRHPTEPSAECGPRWTETYPPDRRGGFTRCRMVSTTERPVRAVPSEDGEDVDTAHEGEALQVVGARDGWLEVLTLDGTGWIPEAQATRRCGE